MGLTIEYPFFLVNPVDQSQLNQHIEFTQQYTLAQKFIRFITNKNKPIHF